MRAFSFAAVAAARHGVPGIAVFGGGRWGGVDPAEKTGFEMRDTCARSNVTRTPVSREWVGSYGVRGGEALDHLIRNRWYDPSTGTFLSPDPMGYQDSSNLYAGFAGDPVNRRDPTGTTVALYGSAPERDAALKRILGTIDNPEAASHITVDAFNRLKIKGMTNEEFIRRYKGRAQQLGQMIQSNKIVFVSELRGELPHPIHGSRWPQPDSLEQIIKSSGGGFFDPNFFGEHSGKALVGIDPRRYPIEIANVVETANTVFVHEFFGHAYEWVMPDFLDRPKSYTGKINPLHVKNCDVCRGIPEGEAEGLAAENEYRLAHGLPIRTYYKTAEDDYIPPDWLAPHVKKQREMDAKKKKWWQIFR